MHRIWRYNTCMTHCRFIIACCLVLLLLTPATAPATAASPAETAVLCDPTDPYYPLAQEIARAEQLPIFPAWAEALAQDPLYILWVAAPQSLSDPVMVRAGLALKKHGPLPALGVITGSSQDEARALWQRGMLRRRQAAQDAAAAPRWLYAANGESPPAGIFQPQLIALENGAPQPVRPLDAASLAAALAQADHLTFTGHGGGRWLGISEEVQFTAADLPALPPVTVSTGSCQTFRPWVDGSLLIGFIDRGAAAYAGFVFSPMEGYLMGEFRELPFRYTWPEFPIGRVAALQSQGTLRGFAAFPYYYLAGDPRIALNARPPYNLLADDQRAGWRELSYSDTPAGLVPVRVPGGAVYQYVEVPGVGAAATDDLFFNARVQAMPAQGDLYLLFTHPGGPFRIRLRQAPPWHWRVTRPLLDAFDDVALFSPQGGGDVIVIIAGLLFLGASAWRARRRRAALNAGWRRLALECLGAGAVTALVLGLYAALRLPHAAVITKPISVSYPWLLGAGLLAAAGMLFYALARTWRGKLVAVLVAALPALFPGLFVLAVYAVFNIFLAAPQVGAGLYSYRMALQPLLAAGVLALAFAGLFRAIAGISSSGITGHANGFLNRR